MANVNTQFVVNAYRFDPYKNFRFQVRIAGKVVAGVSKVTALKRSTEAIMHRDGGDPSFQRLTPGIWKFEPVTLERGVTYDRDFEAWAELVWNIDGDSATSLANFRKMVTIELLDEQGILVKSYNLIDCWVSEYQALPDLDANAHAIAIERMVLQYHGFSDNQTQEHAQT